MVAFTKRTFDWGDWLTVSEFQYIIIMMESIAFRQDTGAECYILQAARSQQNGTLREG